MRTIFPLILLLFLISCKQEKQHSPKTSGQLQADTLHIEYAKGFSVFKYDNYKILEVKNPFPKSENTYTYLLAKRGTEIPKDVSYDEKIYIPVEKIAVTSTTHIPALENLNVENTLVGFPHPDYISSPKTRTRINENKVTDLGQNEQINMEVLLSLQPDVLVGFAMKENDKAYANISASGIPVIFNGDWNEENPMGKAEWIKFFGALYDKDEKAEEFFEKIKQNYQEAQKLTAQLEEKPKMLAGSMYRDVWYLPGGKSWMAKFIEDAGGDYIFKENNHTGSFSLSFESVLNQAQHAQIWIAPDGFTSFDQLEKSSQHYTKFDAFKQKEIYGYAHVKGETGGVLYFELAPNRPDIILMDLIKIFHPELLPERENVFFKSLE